jgi:REP element-mobilizing transposase RayT
MTTPDDKPHSRDLRKGRYSAPGMTYFITCNVEQRRQWLTPPAREIVIDALRWSRDNNRLWLFAYVILDNHFHTLFMLRDAAGLDQVIHSIKRHCARQANLMIGRAGQFWQEGYHDHAIRDEADFWEHVKYMHDNPVRRDLVERPEDYFWSTAHADRKVDSDWERFLSGRGGEAGAISADRG